MTEQFIKIPVQLLKGEEYKDLSISAIVLYALLIDRLELSMSREGEFQDTEGKHYVVMPLDEIAELIHVSKNTATKFKKELLDHGLLEEKKQGSRATLFYPQKLKIESGNVGLHALVKAEKSIPKIGTQNGDKSQELGHINPKNWDARIPKIATNESQNLGTNQTNNNQTDINQTLLATRQSNNVDRDFKILHNLALDALGKMHFSSNEFQVFRHDVREATSGDKQEFELVKLAIEEARKSNASSWNYVSTILKSWRAKGIKNEEDLYENKRKRKEDQLPELPDWLGL